MVSDAGAAPPPPADRAGNGHEHRQCQPGGTGRRAARTGSRYAAPTTQPPSKHGTARAEYALRRGCVFCCKSPVGFRVGAGRVVDARPAKGS